MPGRSCMKPLCAISRMASGTGGISPGSGLISFMMSQSVTCHLSGSGTDGHTSSFSIFFAQSSCGCSTQGHAHLPVLFNPPRPRSSYKVHGARVGKVTYFHCLGMPAKLLGQRYNNPSATKLNCTTKVHRLASHAPDALRLRLHLYYSI